MYEQKLKTDIYGGSLKQNRNKNMGFYYKSTAFNSKVV